MGKRTPESIQQETLNAYGQIKDSRRKEIVLAVIRHLHAFSRDIQLTHDEWLEGIQFLTNVGQICDDERQEFILLSDLLGLSAAVELQDRNPQGNETPGSVVGPFHVNNSPYIPIGGSIDLDHIPGGQSALVKGRVVDIDGNPIAGAELDIWQTAPNQNYAVQDKNQSENNLRGRQLTDEDGRYTFITVKPVPYSVPRDGPCGYLLNISGRHGMRAAHIHIGIEAKGFKSLVTEIFVSGDEYLHDDTVFGACDELTMAYHKNTDSSVPTELVAEYDFVLRRT